MRVSFDLDDTLIPSSKRFPLEPKPLISKLFKHESLRLGTKDLLHKINQRGHKIIIYTTSYRSKIYIKFLFRIYGIKIEQIINQIDNLDKQAKQSTQFSKNPKLFNIDLHIDDLQGVKMESNLNRSEVLIIEDSNSLNVKKLIEKISYFSELKAKRENKR